MSSRNCSDALKKETEVLEAFSIISQVQISTMLYWRTIFARENQIQVTNYIKIVLRLTEVLTVCCLSQQHSRSGH